MHNLSLSQINSTPRYTSAFRCPARDRRACKVRAMVRYRLVPIRPPRPFALSPLFPRRAVSISARPGARRSLYKLISRYVLRYAASHRTTCRYLVLHRTSDRRG